VPRSFVSDASGVGTTMLIAGEGADLEPRFQGRSAAAHQAGGAVHLDADRLGGPLADARRDVDSEVDLDTAIGLGLGAATAALVDPQTRRIGRYAVITATEWRDDQGQPLAVTETGHRVVLPPAALGDGIRSTRLGQRLHAVLAGDRVLSAWW
jgi:2-phospho-L-lactate guanylyltransferase